MSDPVARATPAAAEDRRDRSFGAGDALVLFTALTWGMTFPVSKPLLEALHPFVFASARFTVVALLLMAFQWARGHHLGLGRRDLPRLLVLGLLGFTLVQITWSVALSLTTASKGAILVATSPIFGAFFAFLQGERPGWRAIAGILLSFAGVFVLLNNSLTRLNFGGGSLAGDLLFLFNAALWALYTTVAAPTISRYGPMKTVSYAALFGAIGLLPFGLYGLSQQDLLPLPPWLGLNFLFVAVFSGAVGLSTYNAALSRLGITRTIAYMYLVPVLAILGSILFLGEAFSWLQGLGAATVLAGIAQTRRASRRKVRKSRQVS